MRNKHVLNTEVVIRNVMIDLETLGRTPGAALRSVGAVSFELEGSIGETFYRNIDAQSCIDHGLLVEPETEAWWAKQPKHVAKMLEKDKQPVDKVVREMHEWFWQQNAMYLWCNGASFDAPLWHMVALKVGCATPWNYWSVNCARTLCQMAGINIAKEPRDDDKHNALADCLHQIKCVQKAFHLLMRVSA